MRDRQILLPSDEEYSTIQHLDKEIQFEVNQLIKLHFPTTNLKKTEAHDDIHHENAISSIQTVENFTSHMSWVFQ